jgi:DNA-binding winged helix-turn-helix (wHTH) protein
MRYSFADCVLDTQLYTLTRAGTPHLLRRKVFQVLVYLLTHRDHVVSREELCAQVWPGQFISETTLESCIKRTRQAVGDSGQAQQLIETRRGYGYRFIGAVETCPASPTDAASAGVLAPLRPPSTLPQAVHDLVPEPSPQGIVGSAAGCPETDARDEEASFQRHTAAAVGEWKLVTVLCCAVAGPPMGDRSRASRTTARCTPSLPWRRRRCSATGGPSSRWWGTTSSPSLGHRGPRRTMPGAPCSLRSTCSSACTSPRRRVSPPSAPGSRSGWGCTRVSWAWASSGPPPTGR